MLLNIFGVLLLSSAAKSTSPFVSTCLSVSTSAQLWTTSSNRLQSLLSSSCLATVDCYPTAGGDVTMSDCSSSHCRNSNNTWRRF